MSSSRRIDVEGHPLFFFMTDSVSNLLAEIPEGHRNAVIGLAAEAHAPVELVADAYRRELLELRRDARITQFLPVIASRRVRQRLRQRHATKTP
jgi:hypothetical protein